MSTEKQYIREMIMALAQKDHDAALDASQKVMELKTARRMNSDSLFEDAYSTVKGSKSMAGSVEGDHLDHYKGEVEHDKSTEKTTDTDAKYQKTAKTRGGDDNNHDLDKSHKQDRPNKYKKKDVAEG